MASSNVSLSSFKSHFLGRNHFSDRAFKPNLPIHKPQSYQSLRTCAKFNLSEILGGRGLCNGEAGLQEELKRNVEEEPTVGYEQETPESLALPTVESVPEEGFEKELLGLTGGFPGGEKGLKSFIEKNPPPKKTSVVKKTQQISMAKPKAPELPLLLPGMIAIVSNPNNPFYMYTGIVQRITDGRAGVLFEGGNWDRLITFRLEELERREKGPPGKNPQSAILEAFLPKDSQ